MTRFFAASFCCSPRSPWRGRPPRKFDGPQRSTSPRRASTRLTLGKVDVIAVNDGAALFDVLGVVTPSRKSDAAKIMAKSLVTSPFHASVNAYVILMGNKTILVDAAPRTVRSEAGGPPDSCEPPAFSRSSVTDILVTHIHPDHTGGLTVGGKKIFPNTVVHVNKKSSTSGSNKSSHETMADRTRATSNRWQLRRPLHFVRPSSAVGGRGAVSSEYPFAPGLRPHARPHLLRAGGRRTEARFLGRHRPAPDAQFEDPSITIAFDIDQKARAATRQKAFAEAAEDGYLVALDHMDFLESAD